MRRRGPLIRFCPQCGSIAIGPLIEGKRTCTRCEFTSISRHFRGQGPHRKFSIGEDYLTPLFSGFKRRAMRYD